MANDMYVNMWASALTAARRKKIIFTNGCFDVFHAGHMFLFSQMRFRHPNGLIVVGVNDDYSVRRLKGPERPINCAEDRLFVLQGCKYIDFALPFGEDTPENIVLVLRPDVIVKGEDYKGKEIVGADHVKSWGGQVELVPIYRNISSTGILEKGRKKCRKRKPKA